LSIFAAIVLAFSGSLSFIGSALTGMANVSAFKSVFIVALCGLVVFNLIFLLLYIVGKLTGRSIYTDFGQENSDIEKCTWIGKVRRRLPYVFWINICLLLIMLGDFVCWLLIG
jgi:hypothetical protein